MFTYVSVKTKLIIIHECSTTESLKLFMILFFSDSERNCNKMAHDSPCSRGECAWLCFWVFPRQSSCSTVQRNAWNLLKTSEIDLKVFGISKNKSSLYSQYYSEGYSLKRVAGPCSRFSAVVTQLRGNITAVASRRRQFPVQCPHSTRPLFAGFRPTLLGFSFWVLINCVTS